MLIRAYIHYLSLHFLFLMLTKQNYEIPDSNDFDFLYEISCIFRLHRIVKTTSLVLSIDQFPFLEVLENLKKNANTIFRSNDVGIENQITVEEHKDADSSFRGTSSSHMADLKNSHLLFLNGMYEYLVKHLQSKKWKNSKGILKNVLKEWKNRVNIKHLFAESNNASIDSEKLLLGKDEIRKLTDDLQKNIKKEKKFYFNCPASQLVYGIPVKNEDLQIPLDWERMKPENLLKKISDLSSQQVCSILKKRHEVAKDEYPKIRPDEELLKKKILDVISEINKQQ